MTTNSDKPKHGETRNRSTEHKLSTVDFTTPEGTAKVTYVSEEFTVSERYCSNCGKWVTCKGIIDNILCPECHNEW